MRFPEFHSALLAWRRAGIKRLRTALPLPVADPLRQWTRAGDGHFRLRQHPLQWNPLDLEALVDLDAYARLQNAAYATPAISRHLDQLVGTSEMQMRWELPQLFFPFLPTPASTQDGETVMLLDERPFGDVYAAFEDFVVSDEIASTTVWPTPGLTLDQGSLLLERGVALRRLRDLEVAAAIAFGFIRGVAPSLPLVTDPGGGFYGLVLTTHLPKRIGEHDDPEAVDATEAQRRRLLEDLRSVAAVSGVKALSLSGSITEVGWTRAFSKASLERPYTRAWHLPEERLSRSDAPRFRAIWRSFRGVNRERNAALHLAARRLSYRSERLRAEDQMLDVMIAAEALYLSDSAGSPDQGELRYRLALRAALWADPRSSDRTRREVLALMRKAYDVRSVVAHGGTPAPKLLRLNGQPIALQDLVDQTAAVVRAGIERAIRRALRSPDGRLTIDWEAMIL